MGGRNGHWFGTPRAFEEEGAALDGLRVIFDQKVGLFPAQMQKKPARRSDAGPRTRTQRTRADAWSYGRR